MAIVKASTLIRLASSSQTPLRLGPRSRSGSSAERNRISAPVRSRTDGGAERFTSAGSTRPSWSASPRKMRKVASESME
jgi:hypothetical protein